MLDFLPVPALLARAAMTFPKACSEVLIFCPYFSTLRASVGVMLFVMVLSIFSEPARSQQYS